MIAKKEFYINYNSNSEKNLQKNEGSLMARLALRNIAHPLAYELAKYNVSANKITFLMLLFYCLASAFLIIPGVWGILLFIFLFVFADLLDCTDGQLARYFGTASSYGKVLDSFVHTLAAGLFYVCLGLRLFNETNEAYLLIVGAIGAVSFLFDSYWLNIHQGTSKKSIGSSRYLTLLSFMKKLYFVDNKPLVAVFILLLWLFSDFAFAKEVAIYFFIGIVSLDFITKIMLRLVILFKETSKIRDSERS